MVEDGGGKGKGRQRDGYIKKTENEGKEREHRGLRISVHGVVKHCEYVERHREFMKQWDRWEKGAVKNVEKLQ